MPELPEVETTMRGIKPFIDNSIIQRIVINNSNMRWPIDKKLPRILKNQPILNLIRRGKYLIFSFEHGHLILHLGMSGSLRVLSPSTPLDKHDHFEMYLRNNKVLRLRDPRRFGSVLWTKEHWENYKLLKNLGPEPLGDEFYETYLFEKSRKRNVCVKSFIMNSNVVVGVGNIYASESLFLAAINPNSKAGKISKLRYEKLTGAIIKILSSAIKQGGTTLKDFSSPDGKPGYFTQQLSVYGKEGQPCPVCNHPIKNKTISQRATFYCTQCQR